MTYRIKASALIIAACLSACSAASASPEIEKCEQHIRSQLKNPDTYSRGQHDSLKIDDYWQVGIEYGYLDENGQKVERAWQLCNYALVDGKADTSKFLNLEGSADTTNMTQASDL